MSTKISVLNEKIDALGRKTAEWRDDVQVILVDCAEHAFLHRNVDPLTRLVLVLKGADMHAVVRWIEKFTPSYWSKKDNKFKFREMEAEFDAGFLIAQRWYEKATEAKQVSSVYDVLEKVQEMIKRAEREVNATTNIKTVLHKDLLSGLRVVVGQYEEAMKAAKEKDITPKKSEVIYLPAPTPVVKAKAKRTSSKRKAAV